MSLICPDVSEPLMLNYILNKQDAPTNVVYHLFTSNPAVGETTTVAAFTELNLALYTPLVMLPVDWTIATVAGVTTATAATESIDIGGACTIYGYYVLNGDTNQLLWFEKFVSGPISYAAAGGTLNLTPTIGLD